MIANNVLLKFKKNDADTMAQAKNVLLGIREKIEVLMEVKAELP